MIKQIHSDRGSGEVGFMHKIIPLLFLVGCGPVYVTQESLDCCECWAAHYCTIEDTATCAEALDGEGVVAVSTSCIENNCVEECIFTEKVDMRP